MQNTTQGQAERGNSRPARGRMAAWVCATTILSTLAPESAPHLVLLLHLPSFDGTTTEELLVLDGSETEEDVGHTDAATHCDSPTLSLASPHLFSCPTTSASARVI